MASREIRDVTIPDEGDYFPAALPVEAIRAYSVGRLPDSWADGLVRRARETEDDGLRVRVAQVLIDGEWVPL